MKTVQNYKLHTITVDAAGEKKLFQIKLPRNAKKITGILITVKVLPIPKGRPKEPIYPVSPILPPPVRAVISPLIPIEHAI